MGLDACLQSPVLEHCLAILGSADPTEDEAIIICASRTLGDILVHRNFELGYAAHAADAASVFHRLLEASGDLVFSSPCQLASMACIFRAMSLLIHAYEPLACDFASRPGLMKLLEKHYLSARAHSLAAAGDDHFELAVVRVALASVLVALLGAEPIEDGLLFLLEDCSAIIQECFGALKYPGSTHPGCSCVRRLARIPTFSPLGIFDFYRSPIFVNVFLVIAVSHLV